MNTHCPHGHELTSDNLRGGKRLAAGKRECLTCHRLAARRRYHRDRERQIAATSEYQKRNRPARNAYMRQWRKVNAGREAERAKAAKRVRYLLRGSDGRAYREVLRGDPCAYCGGPSYGTDHITPLSAGGENDWHNLTAACLSCNSTKRTDSLLLALLRLAPEPARVKASAEKPLDQWLSVLS